MFQKKFIPNDPKNAKHVTRRQISPSNMRFQLMYRFNGVMTSREQRIIRHTDVDMYNLVM